MSDKVYVFFQTDDFKKKVIVEYALFIIGVKSEIVDKSSDIKLSEVQFYYGDTRPENYEGVFIQKKETIQPTDVHAILNNSVTLSKNIQIDIVQLLEVFICDTVNDPSSLNKYDELDRLTYETSYQFKNNFADLPVANVIIRYLEEHIDAFYQFQKIPLWPGKKKCVIILSHDVDEPIKHANLFNYQAFPKRPADLIKHYYHLLRLTKNFVTDKNKNDYWLFDEIVDFEKLLGFKSTFFFAVVDKWQGDAHPYDVNYKISNKVFAEAFKKIRDNGSEIGLHASFNAYKSTERFIAEKNKLEQTAQINITGLRHHYWHMAKNYRDTLYMHDAAGFEYDSSVAFNFNIGFRNNIALPYPVFHPATNRFLKMMEIPSFCMDGHVFYKHEDVEKGFKEITEAVSRIKKCGGLGAIDWHVRTSFPKNVKYKNWGTLYVKILNYLAQDNEIWVTSCNEVMNWFKERKEKLTVLKCL
ncbi:MAG TPA: hypothetical protein VFF27_08735 [Bacteroidia bacterium]|jgi:hypothetical protein|nr:hypothetical protein [Bacteroidia bacterium]